MPRIAQCIGVLWTGIVVCLLAGNGAAQTAAPNEPSNKPSSDSDASTATAPVDQLSLDRVQPDIFLLPDKDGNLQTVIGFQYEDFLEAWRIKQGVAEVEHKPKFNFASLSIDGKQSRTGIVELTICCDIVPLLKGPIAVPLQFGNVIVLEVKRPMSGDSVVFNDQQGGLVAWVDGEVGKSSQLQLRVLVQLRQSGGKTRLHLTLPKAEVAELSIVVPSGQLDAETNHGIVESEIQPDGSTRINVHGPSSEFELAWTSSPRSFQQDRLPLLQATGAIMATIDGHGIVTEARLSIQSFGGPFNRCRVRLPAGARLRTAGEGEYTWEKVMCSGQWAVGSGEKTEDDKEPFGRDANGVRAGDVYEFRFAEPQTGTATLDIVTEQPIRVGKPEDDTGFSDETAADLSGFEVLGAVRQFGHVAVQLDENLRLDWQTSESIRQTASLPQQLQRDDLVAAFKYFRQPWSLRVRVLPRPSQVRTQVDHLLVVGKNDLLWRGTFQLRMQNTALFALRVSMPGWELEPDGIGPRTAVDAARFVVERDGVVTIPMRQPIDGDVTVTVTARRCLSIKSGRLAVHIPSLKQTPITTATLTVASPGHIYLQPDLGASRGLVPMEQQSDAVLPVPLWSPRLLAYRCFMPSPEFVAQVTRYTRKVLTEAAASVMFDHDRVQIEETLTWIVQNEPIERLTLEVPAGLDNLDSLEATLDGKPITLPSWGQETVDMGQGTWDMEQGIGDGGQGTGDGEEQMFSRDVNGVHVNVQLPQPLIGRISLVLRYALDLPRHQNGEKKDDPRHVAIPLILPVDNSLARNVVTVSTTHASSWEVAFDDSERQWKQSAIGIENGVHGTRTVLHAKANDNASILPLVLTDRPKVELPDVIVDRAWIQSQLGETTTRTRCLFVVHTTRSSLDIVLPRPDETDVLEVRVDGRPTSYERIDKAQLNIPLDTNERSSGGNTNDGAAIHRVELVLHGPGQLGAWRRVALESPGIADGAVTRNVYWQVITPSHTHLLDSTKTWTHENVWRWDGLSLRRVPVMNTRALAKWIDDKETRRLPVGTNVYVFSSLETVAALEVSLVSRTILVLLSSGLSLGIGLLLIYIPRMRRPALLWTGATLLAAVAVWKTDFTILVTQGAGLGLLLGVLALLLRRMLSLQPRYERILTPESTAAHHVPGTLVVPTGRSHRRLAADGEDDATADTSPSTPSASTLPTTTVAPTAVFPPPDSHR